MVYADKNSAWYSGGKYTGIGATVVATGGGGSATAIGRFGANSAIVGRSSWLFGSGALRAGNGVLNNSNVIRLGWGKNMGEWSFRLAVGPNKVSLTGAAKNFYQYVRHVHY
jgi:hypothetical protein